ncbi:hypothetical protein [Ureibacillus aquaedulcis]|uniref:PilX-like prepilin protein n=1 Tax=Ureibacillus aquaedulcis TaxID=3058421 RepID=A0ABT8GVR6_9BACL|nr:hypothetical protein [Ureibacillus sp. BA0131]MDN4495508.1 hypothetical protein [Ureibacillus sp. BA0131]
MRRITNNSDGYAILIVLMITAVFTVFALSFLVISANTTKQNNIVEQNSQSVAIAEMGVTYFEHAINNSIHTHQDTVLTYVKNLRANDIADKKNYPDDYYIDIAISEMMGYLQTDVNDLNLTVGIKGNSTGDFYISPTETDFFKNTSKGIDVLYKSRGTEDSKSTTIEGKLKLDFSQFLVTKVAPPGTGTKTTPILQANQISDPGNNLTSCPNYDKKVEFNAINCQITGSMTYDDSVSFDNSKVKVTGALTADKINKGFYDSTLYVLGSMTVYGNMKKSDNINLFVGGAFSGLNFIDNDGITNSVIEIMGSASMHNTKFTNSTMYIGGVTTIHQLNGDDYSTVFINANTTVDTKIKLSNRSKVCINGHLDVNNIDTDSTSKVYAKSSNNSSVNTKPDSFNNACFSTSTTADWGNINLSSEYNYNYK